MGSGEAFELGCHQPSEAIAVDGRGWRRHADEDASAAQGRPDDPVGRDAVTGCRADPTTTAGGQCIWRLNAQTGQTATFVSASTIRKLVQPLVLQ
jgi:hypothetical protein